MLTCQRSRFSLPDDVHYLNCAYMSPLMHTVEEAGIAGIRRKRNPVQISAQMFFEESDEVRELFARLVGSRARQIAFIPAASYGVATVARNVALSRSQNIVVLHEQFPSNMYSWRRMAQETGAGLRVISGSGAAWNTRILEAIDTNTALVALGTVHWADGIQFDLEAIGERAQDVGAAFIVDGTQSVGALPIDVDALKVDALVCAGYKWIMGPYSSGLMHLGDRFLDGVPLEETWIARKGSERFSELVNYANEYQPGARRFDVGERSNFILMPMLAAALKQLLEWQPRNIQAYCRTLMGPAIEAIRALGYGVSPACSGHLFGVHVPEHVNRSRLKDLLAAYNVSVSFRGEVIRVSPHVYNTPEDAAAFQEVLIRAAR